MVGVLQAFVPLLGADRSLKGPPGRVVQNSSLCGTTSVPFLGAYSASKQGMEGLSQGWRRELIPYGIDVVVVGGFSSSPVPPRLVRTTLFIGPSSRTGVVVSTFWPSLLGVSFSNVSLLPLHSASKQGMKCLSQSLRRERIPYGIGVVVVVMS